MEGHAVHGDGTTEQADLVLRGGQVLVMDEHGSTAQAVAVRGHRILWVGSDADAAAWIGEETRVVELAGRTVLPGINDSHLHGTHMGAVWPDVLFSEDPAEAERVESHHVDTKAGIVAAAKHAGERLLALGITSYTEPGIGPGEDAGDSGCCGSDALEVYRELATRGELTQRVTLLGLYGTMDGPSALGDVVAGIETLGAAGEGIDPRWLRIAGVKVFADLIPMLRESWTSHPYDDGTHGGLLVVGETLDAQAEALRRMVHAVHAANMQLGVHATGDLAIQTVLDAVREAAAAPGAASTAELAHYIIHGDLISPAQIDELAELGMFLSAQPVIASAAEEMLATVLGSEVAAAAWPLGHAMDRGVLTLSSDAPVTSPDWRIVIGSAEDRMLRMGADPAPEHARARLHEMLRAYTAIPAAQDRAADWKGTVEAGKVADLAVLSRDPFELGAAALPELDVDLTILDGQIRFERSPSA